MRAISTFLATGALLLSQSFLCAAQCATPIKTKSKKPTTTTTTTTVTTTTSTLGMPAVAASRKIIDTAPPPPSYLSAEEQANIRVYKFANKAVVNIASITASEDVYLNIVPKEGVGTGVIISQDGYILTNDHVVNGASSVRVTLYDGTSCTAQSIGDDPSNDLAVIKITLPSHKKLDFLPFGDSANLQVGQRVLAIGNPFGLDRTLTTGIISSLGRSYKTESGRIVKGVIQTDAAINPGNSGGPLLDSQGHFIGITTAILGHGQSAGIGLAIPINIAKRIAPELVLHHGVSRPDIGIQVVQPMDVGLRVIKLEPNGPAAKAGLSGPKLVIYKDGPMEFSSVDASFADIITGIDGVPVRSADDLLSHIEEKKPGQVVTLTVLRSGKLTKIPVKLTLVSST